jgi:hypothetical protein
MCPWFFFVFFSPNRSIGIINLPLASSLNLSGCIRFIKLIHGHFLYSYWDTGLEIFPVLLITISFFRFLYRFHSLWFPGDWNFYTLVVPSVFATINLFILVLFFVRYTHSIKFTTASDFHQYLFVSSQVISPIYYYHSALLYRHFWTTSINQFQSVLYCTYLHIPSITFQDVFSYWIKGISE